jgi:aldehyde dehydrogenase (NAD+)/retinal dehydrogenase
MDLASSAKELDPKSFNKLYINGAFVVSSSKRTFAVKNPKDNSIVADGIPIANQDDVNVAVKRAEEAFYGPWSKFSAMQRTECLHKLATLMEEHIIPILTLDSLTSGNPVSLIPTREKNYIKNCILYYSGWTDKHKGDYLPADDGKPSSFFYHFLRAQRLT